MQKFSENIKNDETEQRDFLIITYTDNFRVSTTVFPPAPLIFNLHENDQHAKTSASTSHDPFKRFSLRPKPIHEQANSIKPP